jgi:DNA-binding NarL/FixJ family response regulator
LTARERDVLLALCRPLLDRDMFTEPAPTRAIAEELVITQAAVKQHLVNLYDKFGVAADEPNRRSRLANEALRRGAVSLAELRAPDGG